MQKVKNKDRMAGIYGVLDAVYRCEDACSEIDGRVNPVPQQESSYSKPRNVLLSSALVLPRPKEWGRRSSSPANVHERSYLLPQ